MQLNDTILLNALPALVVLIIVEALFLAKEHRQQNKDIFTNISAGAIAVLVTLLTKGIVLYTYSFIYQFRLFTLPQQVWYAWVICFFADDFSFYWHHRLSHKIRFLWASHMVHHSSEKFTFSTAVRSSWTSNLSGVFLFWAWMPLIGIEPSMVLFLKTASIAYQFWLHTETIHKMPKLFEGVFNTPSHHRVHHGSDVQYLDKNHAGTLIIWDKFFGTYQTETYKPTYGLTQNIHSFNLLVIEFFGWKQLMNDLKKSKSIKDCLHYLFDAPGWSRDGSSKTTKQLQAELTANKIHRGSIGEIAFHQKSILANRTAGKLQLTNSNKLQWITTPYTDA